MADIKSIIRNMIKNGMSKKDILSNLEELGVSDPEAVYAEATEQLKEMQLPVQEVKKAGEREVKFAEVPVEKIVEKPVPSLSSEKLAEIEEKLNEIASLLKALQEINKKILEMDRDILLRMR